MSARARSWEHSGRYLPPRQVVGGGHGNQEYPRVDVIADKPFTAAVGIRRPGLAPGQK